MSVSYLHQTSMSNVEWSDETYTRLLVPDDTERAVELLTLRYGSADPDVVRHTMGRAISTGAPAVFVHDENDKIGAVAVCTLKAEDMYRGVSAHMEHLAAETDAQTHALVLAFKKWAQAAGADHVAVPALGGFIRPELSAMLREAGFEFTTTCVLETDRPEANQCA